MTEKYRKVEYKDICGFSITETQRNLVYGLLLGFGAVIFLFTLIANEFAAPFAWISMSVLLLLLGINLHKGKGCKCVLTTAFSNIPIKSIRRLKKARNFKVFLDERIGKTRSLIQAGEIQSLESERQQREQAIAEETRSRATAIPGLSGDQEGTQTPVPEVPTAPTLPPPEASYTLPSKRHRYFAFSLLAMAISSGIHLIFPNFPLTVTALFYLNALIASTMALSKKVDTTGGGSMKSTAIWTIVIYIVEIVVAYIAWIFTMISAQISNPADVQIGASYQTSSMNSTFFLVLHGINSLANLILSAVYFFALKKALPSKED